MGAFAVLVHDFGRTRAKISPGLGKQFAEIAKRIVNNIARQFFNPLRIDISVLLHRFEASLLFIIKTGAIIRIPATPLNPATADIITATHSKRIDLGAVQIKLADRDDQLGSQSLIGIQTQDPVVGGKLQTMVLL